MKTNFIKNFLCLFVAILWHSMTYTQSTDFNPSENHNSDCPVSIVEPEFTFTYDDDTTISVDEDDEDDDNDNDDDGSYNQRSQRYVMFVHGYKGSTASWATASTFLDNMSAENNYFPLNREYSTADFTTLDQVATQIKGNYLAEAGGWSDEVKEKSFFIAHSMGGMALRFLQNKYGEDDRPYGGIITFGSGHGGIFSAETKVNNSKKYEDFLKETCVALSEPYIIDFSPKTIYLLASLAGLFDDSYLAEALCENLAKPVIEFLMDENIDSDLTIEAAASYPQDLKVDHKLALYGVEEDEGTYTTLVKRKLPWPFIDIEINETVTYDGLILPKFFGSALKAPGTFPLFGADASDEVGLKSWAEGINNFDHKKRNAWYRFSHPTYYSLDWGKQKKAFDEAMAWERALRWMRDANFQYQELIGGIQNVEIADGNCSCTFFDPMTGNEYNEQYTYSGNCQDLIGQWHNGYEIVASYPILSISGKKFESDGFVLKNTAAAMPGIDESIRMSGSGHFQMRNDSNTGKEFDNMFKQGSYDRFFKLYD